MKRTLYILLSTAVLASCGGGEKKEDKSAELSKLKKERAALDKKIVELEGAVNKNTPAKAVPVSVMTLEPQQFSATIDVQASITGDQYVTASPQASGTITQIYVRPGQKVSKGQLLASLDAAAIDQQINAQQAQLTLAKQLYEKQQKLWNQNIGTEVQLLQAKANYDAAVSQRAAMQAQKNMYSIKSPINGMVDELPLKVGDVAVAGMSGIPVVSKDKLKAQAMLGENYLGKVKQGDPVTIVFPELKDSIVAKLSYVSQGLNTVSRAFNVEVQLPNKSTLHPNMSAQMKIANYQKAGAIVVPVSAIQKTNEGEIVYVAEGGKARMAVIQTGRNSNGMVEVLGGLKAGDQVVTAGFEELENGEAVEVVK